MTDIEYEKSLKNIFNFYLCYTIIGQERSNKIDDIIDKYSRKLEYDYSKDNLNEMFRSLKERIPDKDWFIRAVENVGFSNHTSMFTGDKAKKRARVTIDIIERYFSAPQGFNIDEYTIEHIIPDSQGDKSAVIGNLIPLEKHLNKKCADKCLKEKCQIYETSKFYTTRRMATRIKNDNYSFDPTKRTDYLAELIFDKILNFEL